jgi:hypothetical protein
MSRLQIAGLIFLGLLSIGCSSREEVFEQKFRERNSERIVQLANLYCLYQQRHGQTSPKDEAELKAYIQELPPKVQKRFMVDPATIDDIFVGPRDEKPFKVRWGAKIPILGPSTPIVFEQEGVDGNFQVAFHDGKLQEVDEAQYDRLWDFDPKSAPTSTRR